MFVLGMDREELSISSGLSGKHLCSTFMYSCHFFFFPSSFLFFYHNSESLSLPFRFSPQQLLLSIPVFHFSLSLFSQLWWADFCKIGNLPSGPWKQPGFGLLWLPFCRGCWFGEDFNLTFLWCFVHGSPRTDVVLLFARIGALHNGPNRKRDKICRKWGKFGGVKKNKNKKLRSGAVLVTEFPDSSDSINANCCPVIELRVFSLFYLFCCLWR